MPTPTPWMNPLRLHRTLVVGVGLVALLLLFWQVGSIGLVDETEPLFVEAARQMGVRHDWLTPFFNGVPRFDKPPLIYWLMGICFQALGVNETAARLPSGLAALSVTGMVAYAASGQVPWRQWWSPEPQQRGQLHTGLLAALLWLVNVNTFFWGRLAYSDMLLCATVSGALLCFWGGYTQDGSEALAQTSRQRLCYWSFYGFLCLAVLTKGPIGLILPGGAIALFLIWSGQVKAVLREIFLLPGLLAVALVCLPWYLATYLANGDSFVQSFFGYHNVERFTRVVNSHAGPWWFHLAVIAVGFFPWSLYLPGAIAAAMRSFKPLRRAGRSQQLTAFALAWFVAVLGFFTLASTKYFSYTLPLMPAAAILVAIAWSPFLRADYPLAPRTGWYWAALLQILASGALAIGFHNAPKWLGNDPWMPNLGAKLQAAGIPELGNYYFALAAGAIAFALWRRSHRQLLLSHVAIFVSFFLFTIHIILPLIDAERQYPLRQVAAAAVVVKQPAEPLVMVGFKKPSLAFYSRHLVEYCETPQNVGRLFKGDRCEGADKELIKASGGRIPLPPAQSLVLIGSNQAIQSTGLKRLQPLGKFGVYLLVRATQP
jgi:4-amino-4-deoxy-L-arabinose transferase-like glycosyltransferase